MSDDEAFFLRACGGVQKELEAENDALRRECERRADTCATLQGLLIWMTNFTRRLYRLHEPPCDCPHCKSCAEVERWTGVIIPYRMPSTDNVIRLPDSPRGLGDSTKN